MRDDPRDPRLPTSPGFWRSPLRGPWFTSVLGLLLLAGITVLFVTGLLSYAAYNPDLSPVNDKTPDKGILGFYLFAWPTDPHWLYRLNQGVHVTLGITLIPVLLAKLWSVVPRLFALPPARSLAHALERISLLLLVGGGLFEFVTGVLNVQLDYVFPGSFYPLHFYGAWVFFAAFVAHALLKTPTALRSVRRLREEKSGLVSPRPAEPTVSRRGAVWFVGGGSLLLFVTTVGQNFGGPRGRGPPPRWGATPAAVRTASRSTRPPRTPGSTRPKRPRTPGGSS
jgi:DMSO/TMAO reductase YedYZ molybdopterin-dependent catalytic subunit